MSFLGFSVVVFQENNAYTSWCPELDVASQGDSMDNAVTNLKEAIELHLECLTPLELQEIKQQQGTRFITTVEVMTA